MSNIQTALLIVHTLIALAIIALVLLQRGKGAEAGAAFGAGASGTVFGARGSTNFFSRSTAVLATLFFVSSLALAYISSQGPVEGPKSLIESAEPVDDGATDAVPGGASGDASVPELPAMESPGGATDSNVDPDDAADELPALDETADDAPESKPQQ
jgi:preprotein translocase subunit SecG